MTTRRNHRRAALFFAAGVLALMTMGAAAAHAEGENLLLFRPHCEKTDQKQCPFFKIEDPTSLGTANLSVGDTLDMDIVLVNPGKNPVKKVRAWLSYDTQVLEGSGLTLSLGLPIHVPGEAEFSATQGYAKIGASSEQNAEPKDEIFPIARVQFRVKAVPQGNKIPIAFYDLKEGTSGHTYVTSVAGDNAPNILAAPTATLIVHVTGTPTVGGSSSVSSITRSSASSSSISFVPPSFSSSSASSVAPVSSAFTVVQVQKVKIGTDGDTLYMSWEKLSSASVRAYNVYYGTTTGRYIQRRTVSAETDGVVIHGLPQGTTYYAAVRGISDQGQETAFSQEVAVQVGNPNTSTSPLLTRPIENGPNTADLTAPQNPVEPVTNAPQAVPGSSGLPSGLTALLLISAASGTLLALRRQFVALPSSRHG